jgi:hypothetical protein
MPDPTPRYAEPFAVAEVLARSFDALYTAASLNLGGALADGSVLETPDAMEAWTAIVGYGSLLVELEPLLSETYRRSYRAGLADLTARFAERHADVRVPLPSWAVPPAPAPAAPASGFTSIADLARQAWAEAPSAPAPARPSAADLPKGRSVGR